MAARSFEDIVVYDYRKAKKTTLPGFMVEELQKIYDLQVQSKELYENTMAALDLRVRTVEASIKNTPE